MARLVSRIVSFVAGLAVLAAPSLGLATGPNETAKGCVRVHAEAPYRGSGYDHLVHLDNRCDKPATCHVSSDVNPEGENATVPPKSQTTVLLWRGSPARTFKAKVTCH